MSMRMTVPVLSAMAMLAAAPLFSAEIQINGTFAKDSAGKVTVWRVRSAQEGASIEVVPGTGKEKTNALFVESGKNSFHVDNQRFELNGCKKLHFSVSAKGTGGFAAVVLLYDSRGNYLGTRVFAQGGLAAAPNKFSGTVEIPAQMEGKAVGMAMLSLLHYPNTQAVFENASLSAE